MVEPKIMSTQLFVVLKDPTSNQLYLSKFLPLPNHFEFKAKKFVGFAKINNVDIAFLYATRLETHYITDLLDQDLSLLEIVDINDYLL